MITQYMYVQSNDGFKLRDHRKAESDICMLGDKIATKRHMTSSTLGCRFWFPTPLHKRKNKSLYIIISVMAEHMCIKGGTNRQSIGNT